jgi:DnaK suppressor protein
MLSAEQIQEFKERLLQTRSELLELEQTGKSASSTVTLDQSRVGRLSRMDALQGQAMSQERDRRRQIELQKISAALQRIDSGDYGYCSQCEQAIALRRLEFDPSAPLCIECAGKNEQ